MADSDSTPTPHVRPKRKSRAETRAEAERILAEAGIDDADLRSEVLDPAWDRVSLRDIYGAVDGVKKDLQFSIASMQASFNDRLDIQSDRISRLTESTNHQRAALESTIEANRLAAQIAVGKVSAHSLGALTAKDLSQALTIQIGHSKMVWLVTAAFFFMLSPIIADHWHMLIERVYNLPFGI